MTKGAVIPTASPTVKSRLVGFIQSSRGGQLYGLAYFQVMRLAKIVARVYGALQAE
jgi:hypothetical protein